MSDPNPFPFPGAAALFSGGSDLGRVEQVRRGAIPGGPVSLLAVAAQNAADAATVLLFGDAQQRAEVNAWMDRNAQRRRQ